MSAIAIILVCALLFAMTVTDIDGDDGPKQA